MNAVWDGIPELRNHTGDILFIEEDHFMTKDFYVTTQKMTKLRQKECPDSCFNINLARYKSQCSEYHMQIFMGRSLYTNYSGIHT